MKKIIFILCLLAGTFTVAQENQGISDAQIHKLMKSVEKMRNLSYKSAITTKVATRQQIQDYVKEQLYREYSKEDLRNQELVLKVFKLVDKDFDLAKFFIDFLTEQAAGIYDYENKKLFIADWMPANLQEPALFHELIHAIDDQYFDLHSYVKKDLLDDQKLARVAVVEGEGTYFMIKYLLDSLQLDADALDFDMLSNITELGPLPGMETASNAPKFLQGQLLFPYLKGMVFVNKFIKKNSIDSLATLYAKPPLSTTQVLHFEKYPGSEPVQVKININPGKGALVKWKKLMVNDMGEYSLFLILKEKLPVEESVLASEGLSGDSYMLLQNDMNSAIVYKSMWDTPKDAKEFYYAFNKWCGTAQAATENVVWSKNGEMNCLDKLQNNTVIVVIGANDKKTAMTLVEE